MKTVAVIPAFNEEGRIHASVLDAAAFCDAVIVVDDASNDATYETAKKAGAIVLRHSINRGQGAALQTGTDYALHIGADTVVHFDADGQMRGEDIPALIQPIRAGDADIVLGTRFKGTALGMPFSRKALLKAAILFTYVLSGIRVSDTHNGFRALSKKAAQDIRISLDRMAHASEILDLIKVKRLRFTEVPVTIRYTEETLEKGQSSLGAIRIVKDILKGKFFDV